ncbi:MAG: two-component regulator propeller domain-containing protein [Halieaceae bacterium]
MSQTADGALWVGGRSGVSRWNGDDGFTQYLSFQSDTESRPGVRTLAPGKDNTLWIGTINQGLKALDTISSEVIQYPYLDDEANSIEDPYVRSILFDDRGVIWVGTKSGGITRIYPDGSTDQLTSKDDDKSLSSNRIWKIFQDRQGRIWVGSESGLNLWLPEQDAFQQYRHDPSNPFSISDDLVYDITQDEGNVIWLGTFSGLSKWNPEITTFTHISRKENSLSTLSNNKISAFAEEPDGRIWVGTIGGGINLWEVSDNSFEVLSAQAGNDHSLGDNQVMSLLRDSENQLWAGTMRRGISRMNIDTGIFENFKHERDRPESLSANAVSNIIEDSRGRIWVATYGGGLNQYLGDDRFRHYPGEQTGESEFPSYFLVDIEEGLDGKLWLASDGAGVIRFDPETENVEVMQYQPDGSNSISGNHIICMLQTKSALWVGTRDTGLNRYADGIWERFDYKDGLPGNAIYGILEDDNGLIWLSHSKGLSAYDPASGEFTNYDTIHGLQGNDFNNGAYLKTADGKLLFGGANGFNVFYPSDIHVNNHQPPIKLTNFTKFNKSVELDMPTYELKAVELDYSDSVLGFEFSALDYTDPNRNRYRYMLAGFDREWVEANGVRQATYTNLGSGEYTFLVQGSNNDGIWSEPGLAIDLRMAAAPWATWWAMALYTMVAIAVVYGTAQAYGARLHREEQRRYSAQLEQLVAERTSALENEITGHKVAQEDLSRSLQEKEVLLKEVHHRVKNNMQVISSLLNIQADSVMDERFMTLLTESQQRIKSMALIHENLYRSDNLLEINFQEYIEMLANGLLRFYRFDQLAVGLELDVVDVYLDIDTAVPCGLIINELVSNSLKHAFKGMTGEGKISVSFAPSDDGNNYRFSVADDGKGIPADVDIENSSSMGLEIVRILTAQLDGSWTFTRDGGTEFIIEFPRKN